MKKAFLAIFGVSAVVALDQLSKFYALSHWREEYVLNPFVLFQVTFNRGISWGILNYSHGGIFFYVTLGILVLTAALIGYAFLRLREGKPIIGELLVIAGSLSNSIDRLVHKGVVDFIVVHKDSWTWPAFNLADSCIVLGVMIMFIQLCRE